MNRRRFVQLAASTVPALATPRFVRAAESRVMRFIPQIDLPILDPTFSTTYVTRNHAYLVFDTLFGLDSRQSPTPQMVSGFLVEDDGKRWELKLRPGLRFHDGAPVLARDCVASIRRWGRKDDLGRSLLAVTDELSAPDDDTIVFRLQKPYPLLPTALGKTSLFMAAMMPERLAAGDPDKPISEMIGSGPFRFVANERVAGERVAYERFVDYRPREEGEADYTSGPKVAYFDRVEWKVINEGATAAAALQRGEVDWLELPNADLVPQLRSSKGVSVDVLEPSGYCGVLRLNHLYTPTNNLGVRRAMMASLSQREVMTALIGTDPQLWRDAVGYFAPNTRFANDAGIDAMTSPRDPVVIKRLLDQAGYNGEKIVLMRPGDNQFNALPTDVVEDSWKRAGLNVDMVAMDWGTLSQRRLNKDAPDKGGWNAFITMNSGTDLVNPAVHPTLRGDDSVNNGWFHDPETEQLRQAWASAPTVEEQSSIARRLQSRAFETVPYIPLGQVAQLTAFRSDITQMLKGVPVFWNVRRS